MLTRHAAGLQEGAGRKLPKHGELRLSRRWLLPHHVIQPSPCYITPWHHAVHDFDGLLGLHTHTALIGTGTESYANWYRIPFLWANMILSIPLSLCYFHNVTRNAVHKNINGLHSVTPPQNLNRWSSTRMEQQNDTQSANTDMPWKFTNTYSTNTGPSSSLFRKAWELLVKHTSFDECLQSAALSLLSTTHEYRSIQCTWVLSAVE